MTTTSKKQTKEELREEIAIAIDSYIKNGGDRVMFRRRLEDLYNQATTKAVEGVVEEIKQKLGLSLVSNLDEDIAWKKQGYVMVEDLLNVLDELESLKK